MFRKIIFSIIFVLSVSNCPSARTYYVKPTGNDNNSGTSEATAWRHIARACSTVVEGDTVLIRAGTYNEAGPNEDGDCVWSDGCGPLTPRHSGSPGKFIVYKGYPGERPIIMGNLNGDYSRYAVNIVGKSYIVLDSLIITKSYRGIFIDRCRNIIVKNCKVFDTVGPENDNTGGVFLSYSDSSFDCAVRACSLYHNWEWHGEQIGDGLNCSGVHSYKSVRCVIEDNVMWDQPAGSGIRLKGGCISDTVRRNIIHDCYSGIVIGTWDQHTRVYENIVYDVTDGIIVHPHPENVYDTKVWNNVVYESDNAGIKLYPYLTIDSFWSWNNIVMNCHRQYGHEEWTTEANNHPDLWSDYNCFYDPAKSQVVFWNGSNYYTLAQYQTATDLDSHSIQQDPLFVDPENHDFHLQSNSPCKGAGKDGVDMGAYPSPDSTPSDTTPPAPVTDLATSNPTSNSITLNWTAPGDDGNTGTASQYDIRYSTTTITDANWSSATQDTGEPAPQIAGTSQSMIVSELNPSTTYYFAIKTADEVPNWSELSNVASGTTQEPGNQPPQVNSKQCEKEGSWVDCSEIGYGATITRVRANVTDSDGTVSSVRFKLENLPDNHVFFDTTGSWAGGDWYVLDNSDLLIQESGQFRFIVTATDDDSAQSSNNSAWVVPWGTLSASLINPTQDLSVYQNQAFSFQAQLTCLGGECGDVEATLDPTLRLDETTGLEDAFININYDQNADLDILCTYTWPQDMVANAILMKWDISSLAGLDIEEARLYLYLYDTGGDDPYTLTVNKIINYNPVIAAANGYTYDGVNGWTPNSQCYNNIPLAQADIGPAIDAIDMDMNLGYKSFDVTALIQDWQAYPETNYGLLINSDPLATSDSYRYFYSQEHTDANQRPYMIITYSGGSSKGAISTTMGATPFYTISSNPQTQVNMKAGDVFNQTWQVVPTGEIGANYEFFVINHPTTYSSYLSDVETPHINITIIQSSMNAPPYFDPPTSDQSVDEGQNLNFSIHVTDPDGDNITLSASNLPGDSTFTDNGAGSGTFDWTPDYNDAGEYLVTFHASDGINAPVDDEVTIIVNDVDTTPPVISNVSGNGITRHKATISWNTDEVATSLVEYGLTPSYGSSTDLDTTLVTDHSQLLTGLHPQTLYHFRVRSRDVADNEAISQDYIFRTAPKPLKPRPIDPPEDTTLGLPNPNLVILNGIDSLGFELLHLFQIDTTIDFNSPNLQQSSPFVLEYVDDSTTLWTVPQGLAIGTYYWRAYAYTNTFPSDTSDPSEVFSFRLTYTDVMDTAYQLTLEYPLPNDTVPTVRPTLVARLVSGSPEMNLLSCQFEVSEDPHLTNNVLSSERVTFSDDRTARWEMTQDLKQNTKFYWRAKLYSQERLLDISQTSKIFTGAIHVFPNPFKPSLGHSHVTFRNIPLNSTIRVTTISGDLVKTFDGTQQTDIVWNVKSEDQKGLASGVYLYWVSHAGKVSSGKIFVIR